MEGFEGLKFVSPIVPTNTYWYIRLNILSKDQLTFIATHFKTDRRFKPEGFGEDIVMSSQANPDYLWTNDSSRLDMEEYTELSFNDLFKEV